MWTVDFETEAIVDYRSPRPVGVAVKYNGEKGVYFAWGHPEENNCDYATARLFLSYIWNSDEPLLFQNAEFDIGVAAEHMDLPRPNWTRVHDTQYLIYLSDPHAPSISLKPSAARILNWPPDEQEAVRQWLIDRGIVRADDKGWGAQISKAPGSLVGEYSVGDVDRTYGLFLHLLPKITDQGMLPAYFRELELAPILSQSTREGIYIDLAQLKIDYSVYTKEMNRATKHIKRLLDRENDDDFNLDSGQQLADALIEHGYGPPLEDWPRTPKGRLSTKRETLLEIITNKDLSELLAYRGVLKTLTGTFMKSWIDLAEPVPHSTLGIIHPHWNQVRGEVGGTRTGRLSCNSPNFQNIPKEFEGLIVPLGYLPPPFIRRYVVGDPGQIFVTADFHSQEIRMLGHFAEGSILEIYRDNPAADIHATAAEIINSATGLTLTRKETKIIAFSIIYGAGDKTTALRLACGIETARSIKIMYLNVLVGVKEFMRGVEARAYANEPVRTFGGRLLKAPPPTVTEDGRVYTREYALLNYLIQGSSADQTKAAIIRYAKNRKHGRFLLTVHDEICISVPAWHMASEIAILRWAMEDQEGLDIPFRATVDYGRNWVDTEKWKEAA